MLIKSIVHVHETITLNGGITLNPFTFSTVDEGFAIQVQGLQASIYPYFASTTTEIYQSINRNIEHATDKGLLYGAWIDTNTWIVYQGLSAVRYDKKEAMELARKYKQKAIFDLKNKKEIFIK